MDLINARVEEPSTAVYSQPVGLQNLSIQTSDALLLRDDNLFMNASMQEQKSAIKDQLVSKQAQANVELAQLQKAKASIKKKTNTTAIAELDYQIRKKTILIESINQRLQHMSH